LLAGTDDPDRPPGYPFRGPGLVVRVAPFAAIAALAEASLALTPGPAPGLAVALSLVLLFLVAAAFALPWERLPEWPSVLMPLAYTGSVLALILAAGPTSGVGIVILVPLIWTALFHRRWESGCILERGSRARTEATRLHEQLTELTLVRTVTVSRPTTESGLTLTIQPVTSGTRLTWSVSLDMLTWSVSLDMLTWSVSLDMPAARPARPE